MILLPWIAALAGCAGGGDAVSNRSNSATPSGAERSTAPGRSGPDLGAEQVIASFAALGKEVVTFVGYSGKGYQDPEAMLAAARGVLQGLDPATTVINIGATPDGIGAVYGIAKELGFATTGVVSARARRYPLSGDVDSVYFVDDPSWGGRLEGRDELSPTSRAMVAVSDRMIAIGGGEVARDELLAARALGKTVRFVAADMDHRKALEKAAGRDLPPPEDFRGAVHAALGEGSG